MKVKCYEVTPAIDSHYDSTVVVAENSWTPAIRLVEEALERLFLEAEEEGKPWDSISVTIKCVEVDESELDGGET